MRYEELSKKKHITFNPIHKARMRLTEIICIRLVFSIKPKAFYNIVKYIRKEMKNCVEIIEVLALRFLSADFMGGC